MEYTLEELMYSWRKQNLNYIIFMELFFFHFIGSNFFLIVKIIESIFEVLLRFLETCLRGLLSQIFYCPHILIAKITGIRFNFLSVLLFGTYFLCKIIFIIFTIKILCIEWYKAVKYLHLACICIKVYFIDR